MHAALATTQPAKRHEKGPIGRPIGPGQESVRAAYWTFTATSSRTNEVCSDESSEPVNFSVTVLPM